MAYNLPSYEDWTKATSNFSDVQKSLFTESTNYEQIYYGLIDLLSEFKLPYEARKKQIMDFINSQKARCGEDWSTVCQVLEGVMKTSDVVHYMAHSPKISVRKLREEIRLLKKMPMKEINAATISLQKANKELNSIINPSIKSCNRTKKTYI